MFLLLENKMAVKRLFIYVVWRHLWQYFRNIKALNFN